MIRRTLPAADPPRWAIIHQIDHALLAAQLAEVWGAGSFARLEPRAALLWAVAHHDDGWRDWDQAPKVDPATGKPRQFTEMEPDDSLAIWSASIDTAAQHGSLEGYVVAGHFAALGQRMAFHLPDHAAAIRAFCTHYRQRQQVWLEAWRAIDRAKFTPELAELCLAQLQFFDALSLWFCCEQATEPDTAEPPESPELTLTPGPTDDQRRMTVWLDPWPLRVDRLELEVQARIVPQRLYADTAELADLPAQSEFLRWQVLCRGVEKV